MPLTAAHVVVVSQNIRGLRVFVCHKIWERCSIRPFWIQPLMKKRLQYKRLIYKLCSLNISLIGPLLSSLRMGYRMRFPSLCLWFPKRYPKNIGRKLRTDPRTIPIYAEPHFTRTHRSAARKKRRLQHRIYAREQKETFIRQIKCGGKQAEKLHLF